MKPRRGYYSVIQFVPDASRMEAVNVGVIVYDVETHTTLRKVTTDFDRVRRFFPKTDIGHLRLSVQGMSDRIEIESRDWVWYGDLLQFAAKLANDLHITSPRGMRLKEPTGTELWRLFDELVEERR